MKYYKSVPESYDKITEAYPHLRITHISERNRSNKYPAGMSVYNGNHGVGFMLVTHAKYQTTLYYMILSEERFEIHYINRPMYDRAFTLGYAKDVLRRHGGNGCIYMRIPDCKGGFDLIPVDEIENE